MEKEFDCILNVNNVRVKKCCASCEHCLIYQQGNKHADRYCKVKKMFVFNSETCEAWTVNKQMRTFGGGEMGRIKKKEYLKWLANRMEDFDGKEDLPPLYQFRAEWMKENNGQSVYLN